MVAAALADSGTLPAWLAPFRGEVRLTVVGPSETTGVDPPTFTVRMPWPVLTCTATALIVSTSWHQPILIVPVCWKVYCVPFTVMVRDTLKLLNTPPAPGSPQSLGSGPAEPPPVPPAT